MSDTKAYRIVSAIVDKSVATFYCEDGEVLTVKQGDYRLSRLLEQIIPITTRGEVAVVSFENFSVYEEFTKKTKGFAKFFKVAKKKLNQFFSEIEDDESEPKPTEIVIPPLPVDTSTLKKVEVQPSIPKEAIVPVKEEASSYAPIQSTPVPAYEPPPVAQEKPTPRWSSKVGNNKTVPKGPVPVHAIGDKDLGDISKNDTIEDNETIVAVIDGIIIPDMEKIKPYIINALKHSSEEGVKNFLIRISKVIQKRTHSVVDLLRFMEKGDLPIANDGSIIAYKALRSANGKPDTFVDLHSGKVFQKVGSYVCINESLVDPNKFNECSNGLHIAVRGYIRSIGGDILTLVKLAPEDVMTVPHADATKIRSMGYHILGVLSREAHDCVKSNKPFTHLKADAALLASAMNGTHVPRLEEVRITEQMGGGLVITPLVQKKNNPDEPKEVNEETLSHTALALDDPSNEATSVSPKTVNKQVNEQIKKSNEEVKPVNAVTEKKKKTAAKKPAKTVEKAVQPKTAPKAKKVADVPKKAVTEAPKAPAKSSAKATKKTSSKPAEKTLNEGVTVAKKPEMTPIQEQVMRMHNAGKKPTEIADETGVSRSTLSGWIKKFS